MPRAVSLVWVAARTELKLIWVLDVVSSVAAAGQLFLVEALLSDLVGPHSKAQRLSDIAPLVVAVALARLVGDFSNTVAQERQRIISELTCRHVQAKVLEVASQVELSTFESASFHDHRARARAWANADDQPVQVALGVSQTASGLVGAIAIGFALVRIQPLVAVLVAVTGLPLSLAASRNSKALYGVIKDLAPINRERAYLSQVLIDKDSAKEIRAYQLALSFLRRWGDLFKFKQRLERLRAVTSARLRRSLRASAASNALFVLTILVILEPVFHHDLSLAAAATAAVGVQLFAGRVQQLVGGFASLYECALFLDDVNTFADLQLAPHPGMQDAPLAAAQVAFDGVSFTYPSTDNLVLDEVSLQLHRGQVVALVGENGAGKSTLVKLLCDLYQPTGGTIRWDGVDATTLDGEAIRTGVATMFQDFLRYQLVASDNVALGRVTADSSEDTVRRAAQAAGADGFLNRLPDGYATILSRTFEHGADLSIGQWQWVALARLFFRDAPVVVLDEPTSALDPIAEHDLFEQVRLLCSDRAVLLISHRFSGVRSANHIYVLDHGRVVEHGVHDDLMESDGLYARMFNLQAAAFRGQP